MNVWCNLQLRTQGLRFLYERFIRDPVKRLRKKCLNKIYLVFCPQKGGKAFKVIFLGGEGRNVIDFETLFSVAPRINYNSNFFRPKKKNKTQKIRKVIKMKLDFQCSIYFKYIEQALKKISKKYYAFNSFYL